MYKPSSTQVLHSAARVTRAGCKHCRSHGDLQVTFELNSVQLDIALASFGPSGWANIEVAVSATHLPYATISTVRYMSMTQHENATKAVGHRATHAVATRQWRTKIEWPSPRAANT
jgi:hypothetical protein